MYEQLTKLVIDSTGEILTFTVTIIIAAIKRKLEKRKLRRKGILRDEIYMNDNVRHL